MRESSLRRRIVGIGGLCRAGLVAGVLMVWVLGTGDLRAQDGSPAPGRDALGAQVYESSCVGCHRSEGTGLEGIFPSLQTSAIVEGPPEPLLHVILGGRGTMPGFADQLGDEELAAVASYIRTSWGNRAEPVTPARISEARQSWGGEDLQAEPADELPAAWREEARELVQQHCVTCHGERGRGEEGGVPPLVGSSAVLSTPTPLIRILIQGRGGMPSFARLSDRDLAYILSYVRTSWGNQAPVVTPEMVEERGREAESP